jgi:regulator of nucleoside diphosphate kinase
VTHQQIILTTTNLWLIESLLESDEIDATVAATLREKAATAVVVMPQDVPADVVTLDSRVRFVLDGRTDERRLIASDAREVRGQTLVVSTPLGATLIGMREGATGSTLCWDGSHAEVSVRSVAYQPEATRRGPRMRPRLWAVAANDDSARARPPQFRWAAPDDDPGPPPAA